MNEFIAGIGVAAIAASGWFGNFVGHFKSGESRPASGIVASTTRSGKGAESEEHKGKQLAKADAACIAKAAATREDALGDGVRAYGDAIADAYDTRADALAAAYASTDDASVRASVKAAWEAFKSSGKTARDTWNATQRAAWKGFEASVKSCGAGAVSVTDAANASADVVPSE